MSRSQTRKNRTSIKVENKGCEAAWFIYRSSIREVSSAMTSLAEADRHLEEVAPQAAEKAAANV